MAERFSDGTPIIGLLQREHYFSADDDLADDLNELVADDETYGRRLPRLFEERPFYLERELPAAAPSEACLATPRRSMQTTNTERILADLESDVVNGLMTPAEADMAFGRKPPRSGGRPRAPGQETFAAWLHTRIAKLSDPDALAALMREAWRLQADRTMRRAQRVARQRVLNRNMTMHDPEYVEQLRAALAELDPLGVTA